MKEMGLAKLGAVIKMAPPGKKKGNAECRPKETGRG